MNFKHFTAAICLAAGLVFAAPSIVPAGGIPGVMSTVEAAEGWVTEGTGKYYYKNSQKVTGPNKIDNTTYYFDASTGNLKTGLSGLYASPNETGVLYYFNSEKNGSIAVGNWIKIGTKYYYADNAGRIKLGTIAVNGSLYHITKNGRMTAYGKSSYDKKYYYATSTGKLKTGLQTIKKKLYYFNPSTGVRQTGTVKVGKYYYYFNTSTGVSKTGWVTVTLPDGEKETYYYNNKGRRLSGLQKINNKYYYLNPKNNDARVEDGTAKINGKVYYFDAKGVRQSGFYTTKGKTYYANSSGVRKKGWITVMGNSYFMDKKTAVMKTGWFKDGTSTYYLEPNAKSSTYGAAITGFRKIEGDTYYFNPDGKMRTGWLLHNMKYYYFDKTSGKMLTGTQKIDGTTYKFAANGSTASGITGSYSVKVNRKECFVVIYKGNTPVKAFICSTAKDGTSTPTGNFHLWDKLRWHELMGPTWGQYCSHITSGILFHSVPNRRYNDNHSLNTSAYNMLGKPASHGCIRLSVMHAKWMYDNLPVGTPVYISDSVPRPKNVIIEKTPKIPSSQRWDPTDPNA